MIPTEFGKPGTVAGLQKTLFVFVSLPRPVISMSRVFGGEEALSGTHGSAALVAEGLARRGHSVAALVLDGRQFSEAGFPTIASIDEAARWLGTGRCVWVYHGNDAVLELLNRAGIAPWIWSEIDVPKQVLAWLETGRARNLVVVSDTARLALLRSRVHERIGRIYNPLSPAFEGPNAVTGPLSERFGRKRVVFAGSPTENKGAHRLFDLWSRVRELDSSAVLQLAGTGRLYGDARQIGRHGIASPDFESRYIEPLVAKFGSLDAAGVQALGLLTPNELRVLFERSSLGIVNLNWESSTETFCCAAVEMLATGLPVFSVARGALPETIGASGGACLSRVESLVDQAQELVRLLADSKQLATLGAHGPDYMHRAYSLTSVLDAWEHLLSSSGSIRAISGPWRGPGGWRYGLERSTGLVGAGRLLDWGIRQARSVMPRRH